ncbi:F0F1 ATP synthase subunit A [Allonocardiopsis opalescens]|uniref:ATP synthase subunit a n=1 Tax=Allonocardiopsis opalescens TaxID=1144618 RepID=A0A2T0QCV7_9ACTN|nr:F0F1 ATP synthase subunit A [Allonocardiopsis opalescens]PRY01786.1 ATP synthase F0 subcomplex A subunit [Allonocardiopsis opalescens]
MSANAHVLAAEDGDGGLFTPGGPGFAPPTTDIFFPPPIVEFGPFAISKYTVLLALTVVVVLGFWFATTSKMKLVPSRWQSVAEMGYLFIRDQVARPTIGKQGDRYVPLLITLFFMILVMNLWGVVPLVGQLPVTANTAVPIVLALIVYVFWNVVGIRKQGGWRYFRDILFMPGVPWPFYIILTPIEVISTLIVRPVTHAVRLFANMFAGHLLLATFAAAGFYMFNPGAPDALLGAVSVVFSGFAFLGFFAFTLLEIVIMSLQAFVFVLLTAVYIGGAVEPAH